MNQKILIIIIAVLSVFIIYLLATGSCKKEEEPGMDINAILKDIKLPNNNNTNNMDTSNQTSNNQEEQIKKEILKQGTGEVAKNGDNITVHYSGFLLDGTKFDSSVGRGTPFSFTLGEGRVIQGWELGLIGSKIGEKMRLTIPSKFAYGETGTPGGSIPPNATLIFEIEVLSIEQSM